MQQKIPYGFKQFNFSNVTVFTGKIRIKCNHEDLMFKLQNWQEHITFRETVSKDWFTRYTTVQFSVTNYHLNRQLVKAIRTVMCEIAHNRVDQKYADCVEFVEPSELSF
jgi:hypothetical protein